jgi:hypothetical protein
MSLPLTSNLTTCPHGQRGTTTCLYCRQEARVAARHRRNRMMAKVGLMTLVGGILAGLAVSALIAVVPRSRPSDTVSASSEPIRLSAKASRRAAKAERVARDAKTEHATKAPAPEIAVQRDTAATPVELSAAPREVPPAPREVPAAPREISATPVIAEGRTEFGEGVFAERTGAEVTVHFDTDDLRTRFEEKFERILRSTLPRVYGSQLRPALDAIPDGALVRGDLLHELPTKGIALSLGQGRTLTVWPVTREGRDGRIVDAYRASAQ